MWPKRKSTTCHTRLPRVCSARLTASLSETPVDIDQFVDQAQNKDETVLYLAYGSNLCNETFRGKRGIKPVAQINVQVPSLDLRFDLPGIPYIEPCFANSGKRDPERGLNNNNRESQTDHDERSALLDRRTRNGGYRKDEWRKGLVGVVYEVTAQDYAHIIATEGGGASYHDILVDCHPFANDDPSEPVPQTPTSPAFKAHTLFAPSIPEDDPPEKGGRVQRPDKGYAQASARYLKLIKDGAAELGLPYEYQDYLNSLRPYKITTMRQRLGQMLFLSSWVPIVMFCFTLGKIFVDDKGRIAPWLRRLTGSIFVLAWKSYDTIYKPIFGDGERSLEDGTDAKRALGTMQSDWGGLDGQSQMTELNKSRQAAQIV